MAPSLCLGDPPAMKSGPTPVEIAEAPFAWRPSEPGVRTNREDARFVLQHDPLFAHAYFGTATLVRIDSGTAAAVDSARAWFRSVGRRRFSWWVRESANSPQLMAELLRHGLEVSSQDPSGVALMRLEDEPPAVPGVVVRRIDSFRDDIAAAVLFSEVFDMDERDEARIRGRIAARWKRRSRDYRLGFLAYLEGRLAARGSMILVGETGYLYSGATAPDARGRGCYRALVRARWEAMRAMGGTSLVVQAGQNSEPILSRLGFRELDRLTVLMDHC